MFVKSLVMIVLEVFLLMVFKYSEVSWGSSKSRVWVNNMNVLLLFKLRFRNFIYVFFKVGIAYFFVVYRVVITVFE